MTDRELLELAAKAAGIGPLDFDYPEREGHGIYFGPRLPMPQNTIMAAMHQYWNPLVNDTDAFRLSVKLGMNVEQWSEVNRVKVTFGRHKDCLMAAYNDDPVDATRNAIVHAAAEIGKAMNVE